MKVELPEVEVLADAEGVKERWAELLAEGQEVTEADACAVLLSVAEADTVGLTEGEEDSRAEAEELAVTEIVADSHAEEEELYVAEGLPEEEAEAEEH